MPDDDQDSISTPPWETIVTHKPPFRTVPTVDGPTVETQYPTTAGVVGTLHECYFAMRASAELWTTWHGLLGPFGDRQPWDVQVKPVAVSYFGQTDSPSNAWYGRAVYVPLP